jgi:OmpR family two-component system sensor histidine kinase YxdK
MRLFWREHLPLILVQLVQLSLVVAVFLLDGYRNLPTALYAWFLGLVGLAGYLGWRYLSHRELYRRLSEPFSDLEQVLRPASRHPLEEAVDGLVRGQYRQYQDNLLSMEQRQADHLSFINQWVHQMKTPLSILHLTVQDGDDPAYASVREEADRLEQGLETVLYAARLESFRRDFRVAPAELRAIAERAVSENKRLFIRSQVYPEVRADEDLFVETDAKWLGFAVSQLLTNAIKYSAKNGKVTLSAVRTAEAVVLEVRDRGIGIPSHDLKRVTEPFYTGDNGRTHRESTGMGLYLVQEICRNLGHELRLDSAPGEGTCVSIVFRAGVLPNLTKL